MQLRNDFKYALIEEYKTYWNAYDNPNEFYSDILSMDSSMFEHFAARRMSAKGMSAITELKLLDQNTLWFVMYGKTKRALECLESINQDKIEFLGQKNRLEVKKPGIIPRQSVNEPMHFSYTHLTLPTKP